ncbi:MAG: TonB-dependent receptor [Treponema sp.]|jgi:outer membrane receptor for ferrienterochelin and colicins|nr:TonB-dependent receptor [Treponema sp.]
MKKIIMILVMLSSLFLPLAAQEEEEDYGDEFFEVEGVTVTGTRGEKRLADSPVVTELISGEEIENSSAVTLSDVLEDYGLMFTGNAMGDYIQMQGMGEDRVLFLIDGRRVVGRISSRLKGETLPLGNVERIEIVRGPQSALYGSDGIGGVINIITKKPEDKVTLSTAVSNRFLLPYNDPDTPVEAKRKDFSPFREQNLSASLGFPIGPLRNSLSIEGSRSDFYYNETKSVSVLPKILRGKAGLDLIFPLGDAVEMKLGGSFLAMRSDEQVSARGGLNRLDYIRADGYIEAGFSPLADSYFSLRFYDNFYQRDKDTYNGIMKTWTTGANHENENYAALEALGEYAGFDNWLLSAGLEGAYASMDKYNLRNNGTFVAVDKEAFFIQGERYKDGLYSILGGLRVERSSQFGFAAAPKFSAMYHLPAGFRVLGGAGLGYRAPDFSDLYLVKDDNPNHPVVQGNDQLKPEYALAFNLALEYSKTGLFFGQINTYYSEMFNEIANVDTGVPDLLGRAVYNTKNIARSYRAGFDSEGRLTILKQGYVSAGYSWLYAYDRTEDTEFYPQPAHTVKLKAGIDLKKPGISSYLQGRFFSALRDPDVQYDPRFILDFYFSVGIGRHVTVYTAVDNITGLIDPLGPYTAQSFTLGIRYVL